MAKIFYKNGCKSVNKQGNRLWYYSPLRKESKPSFCVYLKEPYQDWYDYGANMGGTIIDLVMCLYDWSYIESLKQLRKSISAKSDKQLAATANNERQTHG